MLLRLTGTEALAERLVKMNTIEFKGVCLKNLTEIFNRAKKEGGTPVDTGELRISAGIIRPNNSGFSGEMGYTKEYAPHVEYGHRTKGGDFVQGQHFLQNNIDMQRPIFRQDLLDAIKGK